MNYTHDVEERVRSLADQCIATQMTVRALAKVNGICKSTVHNDLTTRLRKMDGTRAQKVRAVLEKHKAERHIRGGEATRRKYKS